MSLIFCRRPDCGQGYASAGEIPIVCPSCLQATTWSTTPPLKWTKDDEVFLKVQKIKVD